MLGTPTRNRQAERREATRREIIEAAWVVARDRGLANLTLRDVADRVGMRAPSLYSHFDSKHAIYDAMFGDAWRSYEDVELAAADTLPAHPRARALQKMLIFFDFAAADLPRYQLMNQRTIPGFEPSADSYAPAQRVLERSIKELAEIGVTDRGDAEILFAILAGLVDQQLANDPGGDSRRHLLERAMEMWADGVGLPRNDKKPRRRT